MLPRMRKRYATKHMMLGRGGEEGERGFVVAIALQQGQGFWQPEPGLSGAAGNLGAGGTKR